MIMIEAGVWITVVLALVAFAAFLLFRERAKVRIKGFGNTAIDIDASNTPTPAIQAEGLTSRRGGLVAEDNTGRGAQVKHVEVENDIRITSSSQSPKA